MKDVNALSKERIMLSTGTLYGALKRLLAGGWIEPVREDKTQDTGRPRRAYALTPLGRSMLDTEMERLQSLVRTARTYTAKGRA